MIRSKRVEDYFEAKLSELIPGKEITFDIHLYFPINQHLMIWRKKGDRLSADFLDHYQSRGIIRVFIHRGDEAAFQKYLNPEFQEASAPDAPQSGAADPEAPASEDGAQNAAMSADSEEEAPPTAIPEEKPEEKKEPEYKTEQGKKMAEIMASPTLNERQKTALLAKEARTVLQDVAAPENLADQNKANANARAVVRDLLESTLDQAESAIAEIWRLSNVDADLEHGVNVATYSVLFAMAFGRIDQTVINDLAYAGLLHDVGISQVSANVTTLPWKSFTPAIRTEYAKHVNASLEMIELLAPDVSPRVKTIIGQHHEKFDGTGYPQGLEGFRVDDISQLLAMADILDSIATGHWDGKERTLKDTFDTLEHLEKARTFPEHFNPEVFGAVIRWTRNAAASSSTGQAIEVVKKEAQKLMEKGGKAA